MQPPRPTCHSALRNRRVSPRNRPKNNEAHPVDSLKLPHTHRTRIPHTKASSFPTEQRRSDAATPDTRHPHPLLLPSVSVPTSTKAATTPAAAASAASWFVFGGRWCSSLGSNPPPVFLLLLLLLLYHPLAPLIASVGIDESSYMPRSEKSWTPPSSKSEKRLLSRVRLCRRSATSPLRLCLALPLPLPWSFVRSRAGLSVPCGDDGEVPSCSPSNSQAWSRGRGTVEPKQSRPRNSRQRRLLRPDGVNTFSHKIVSASSSSREIA